MMPIHTEFGQFNGESERVPAGLTETVFAHVRSDMNPSRWQIFSKLALIHFVMSLVILSFCPQFGIQVFGESEGLMPYFMRFGEYGCMVGCGAFFLGSTALLTAFILGREELRILRRSHVLAFAILGLLSLGVFAMAHAEIVLGLAAAWLFGSILASSIGFEMVARIRLHIRFR